MGLSYKIARSQMNTLKNIARGVICLGELRKYEGRNYKRKIQRLEEKGLVFLGGEKISLSPDGIKLIENIGSRDIALNIPKGWNGQWHIVAYDIPEELKHERNYFRIKLKKLGFVKLQASMWLYPYDCKEEIAVFAHSLRISPFVIYLTTDNVPGNHRYVSKFNL